MFPGGLEPLERGEHFKRLNLMNGSISDCRCELVEKVVGLYDRSLSSAVLNHHLLNVFAGDCLESLRGEKLFAYLLLAFLKGWVPT